jgi:hypothetical protein
MPQAAPAAPGPGAAAPVAPSVEAPPASPVGLAPTQPPSAEPLAEDVPDAPPNKLSVGAEDGVFQPSLLLQAWLWRQPANEIWTFRARRAELKVKGEIVPDFIAYQIMLDPAKLLGSRDRTSPVQNQSPPPLPGEDPEEVTISRDVSPTLLQDLFITFLSDYADVSLGQFKTPVSWEGFNSSSKILFPERALVSRQFGDRRDLGIRADKKFEYFGYSLGVFNGEGQNRIDTNDQKDLALRLEAYPVENLMIGAMGLTSVGERDEAPTTKDRLEGDFRLDLANVLVQFEYIHAWDGSEGSRTEGRGFYLAGGYTFFDRLQPIVRWGYLDTDLDSPQEEVTSYEFGFNYFLQKYEARLMASYGVFDPDSAPGEEELQHEFIAAAQVAF